MAKVATWEALGLPSRPLAAEEGGSDSLKEQTLLERNGNTESATVGKASAEACLVLWRRVCLGSSDVVSSPVRGDGKAERSHSE